MRSRASRRLLAGLVSVLLCAAPVARAQGSGLAPVDAPVSAPSLTPRPAPGTEVPYHGGQVPAGAHLVHRVHPLRTPGGVLAGLGYGASLIVSMFLVFSNHADSVSDGLLPTFGGPIHSDEYYQRGYLQALTVAIPLVGPVLYPSARSWPDSPYSYAPGQSYSALGWVASITSVAMQVGGLLLLGIGQVLSQDVIHYDAPPAAP